MSPKVTNTILDVFDLLQMFLSHNALITLFLFYRLTQAVSCCPEEPKGDLVLQPVSIILLVCWKASSADIAHVRSFCQVSQARWTIFMGIALTNMPCCYMTFKRSCIVKLDCTHFAFQNFAIFSFSLHYLLNVATIESALPAIIPQATRLHMILFIRFISCSKQ